MGEIADLGIGLTNAQERERQQELSSARWDFRFKLGISIVATLGVFIGLFLDPITAVLAAIFMLVGLTFYLLLMYATGS